MKSGSPLHVAIAARSRVPESNLQVFDAKLDNRGRRPPKVDPLRFDQPFRGPRKVHIVACAHGCQHSMSASPFACSPPIGLAPGQASFRARFGFLRISPSTLSTHGWAAARVAGSRWRSRQRREAFTLRTGLGSFFPPRSEHLAGKLGRRQGLGLAASFAGPSPHCIKRIRNDNRHPFCLKPWNA